MLVLLAVFVACASRTHTIASQNLHQAVAVSSPTARTTPNTEVSAPQRESTGYWQWLSSASSLHPVMYRLRPSLKMDPFNHGAWQGHKSSLGAEQKLPLLLLTESAGSQPCHDQLVVFMLPEINVSCPANTAASTTAGSWPDRGDLVKPMCLGNSMSHVL